MRKLWILVLIATFLILSVTVKSQEEELATPSILPDHPLYPLKTLGEKIRLWLAFNHLAKARVHLQLAEARLAELNAVLARGKVRLARQLVERYRNEIESSTNETDAAEAAGRNIEGLAERVGNSTFKHILVLTSLLDRVPPEAREHILHAINASSKGHFRVLAKLREKRAERAARLTLRFTERIMERVRERVRERRIRGLKEILKRYGKEVNESNEALAEMERRGRNITELAERVANMTYKHIKVLKSLLDRVPPEAREHILHAINASSKGHEVSVSRILRRINSSIARISLLECTSDEDCLDKKIYCPTSLGWQPACFIPPNRTTGRCTCMPIWKIKPIKCTLDEDCSELKCPKIVGIEKPVCRNGVCVCGASINETQRAELRERIRERINERIQNLIRRSEEIRIRTR